MINKLADFINIVTKSQNVFFYYADDVCEAAIEYLQDNSESYKVKAVIAEAEQTKRVLCGIEIKDVNDTSLDKEIPVIITARKI